MNTIIEVSGEGGYSILISVQNLFFIFYIPFIWRRSCEMQSVTELGKQDLTLLKEEIIIMYFCIKYRASL